jgi:hypothetical protein
MLAGDVTARIVSGNLIIKGDSNSNVIAVTQLGTTVTVAGTGTRVNSGAGAVALSGFTGRVSLKMKGRNDSVTLSDLTATSLEADMGSGNDTLDIENCTINGATELDGDAGNDTFTINTTANSGGPNATSFNGLFEIDLGRGADTITMVNTFVTDKTKIKGGSRIDNVTIGGSIFTTLDTDLGNGNDSLSIANTSVGVTTKLNGGKGTNTFANGLGNTLANLTQKNFT